MPKDICTYYYEGVTYLRGDGGQKTYCWETSCGWYVRSPIRLASAICPRCNRSVKEVLREREATMSAELTTEGQKAFADQVNELLGEYAALSNGGQPSKAHDVIQKLRLAVDAEQKKPESDELSQRALNREFDAKIKRHSGKIVETQKELAELEVTVGKIAKRSLDVGLKLKSAIETSTKKHSNTQQEIRKWEGKLKTIQDRIARNCQTLNEVQGNKDEVVDRDSRYEQLLTACSGAVERVQQADGTIKNLQQQIDNQARQINFLMQCLGSRMCEMVDDMVRKGV